MSSQPNQRSARALSLKRPLPNNRLTQLEERMDRTEERLAELEFLAIQIDARLPSLRTCENGIAVNSDLLANFILHIRAGFVPVF